MKREQQNNVLENKLWLDFHVARSGENTVPEVGSYAEL